MIFAKGRFSWTVIALAAFSTLAIVLIDLAWRIITVSISVIGAAAIAILLIGNGAILLAAKSRRPDPRR